MSKDIDLRPPLGKEQVAKELEEIIDNNPLKDDLCPLCGSLLAYCPQGEFCTNPKCSYAL